MTKPPKRAATAANDIRAFIAAELQPGDKLPSEAELTRRLQVSRVTVREALSQLWVEGLVTRRWGVGTFVRERRPVSGDAFADIYVSLGEVGSLPRGIAAAGHTPGLAHANVEQLDCCPAAIATELGIEPGEPVWRVERCITINGQPGVLLRDHVPTRVNGVTFEAPQLTSLDTDFPGMIQRTGTRVVRDEARLEAVSASEDVAHHLGVPAGTAILHERQTSHADTGDVVVSTQGFYRSDVFSIVLVRTVPT